MSLSVPPLSPSSRRHRPPLHERTPSQTNQQLSPAPTLRLVMDKDSDDEVDIYATDPYPSKPEHVLLPTAGDQDFHHDFPNPLSANPVSAAFQNPHPPYQSDASRSSTEDASRTFADDRGGSVSELSTLVQEGNLSSFIWGDSQNSSHTSIPHLTTPIFDGGPDSPDKKPESSHGTRRSPLNQTTPTIKAVPQESATCTPDHSESGSVAGSSPNVVPLGLPSSPNVIPFESSSPNFMPVASSSPYYVKESPSESSLYSANTFGTARRYVRPRFQTPAFLESESTHRAHSFTSSPPSAILRTHQSASSFALSRGGSTHTRTTSGSTRSGQPQSDLQTIIDSGVTVRYPVIRSPSSTGSSSEGSGGTLGGTSSQVTRYRSGSRNPHLSVVPSEWSAEANAQVSSPSPQGENPQSPSNPPNDNATSGGRPSDFSIRLVDRSEDGEGIDTLAQLQPYPLRTKRSGSLSNHSMVSRWDSFRFMNRPGSSASAAFHTFPAWAKVYYKSGGTAIQFSALSLVEGSRPSTAAGAGPATHLSPIDISRTRPRKNTNTRLALPTVDTRDPRIHWAGGLEQSPQAIPRTPSRDDLPAAWSPHLYPDHRVGSLRRALWIPPSLDETAEGIISWRNVQIYLFCLGFLMPLTWVVASFLPLPPKVAPLHDESTTGQTDAERTFNNRIKHIDQLRYENARWWRRLNRCMVPVGLVIVGTIITLTVLGIKNVI